MILKGRLTKLMVKVAPNLYRKFISVSMSRCRRQSMGFSGVPYYSTRSL